MAGLPVGTVSGQTQQAQWLMQLMSPRVATRGCRVFHELSAVDRDLGWPGAFSRVDFFWVAASSLMAKRCAPNVRER